MTLTRREEGDCGANPTDNSGLRIGAVFVILVTSLIGTLFPVITKRTRRLRRLVPGAVFEFGKFFGSGVILATALIHLLEPAVDAIGEGNTVSAGGCIPDGWAEYPYPFALCLASLFFTFVVELFAFRFGKAYMKKHNLTTGQLGGGGSPDNDCSAPDAPDCCPNGTNGASNGRRESDGELVKKDSDSISERSQYADASEKSPPSAQILGVVILEFGILFHSLIIGMTLTLSPPDEFTTLFIVIIFHQMFEGLGLGTRLAFLQLPPFWSWAPLFGAIVYSVITPLGMAIGLGTRQSVSMSSATASITSGVLDAISSGILLYAATVELIAHEFIFSSYYHTCSWKRVTWVLTCFAVGAGLMALLGKWA